MMSNVLNLQRLNSAIDLTVGHDALISTASIICPTGGGGNELQDSPFQLG